MASLWIGFILQTEELPLNGTEYDYASMCGSQNCFDTKLPEATSKPTLNSVYALMGTVVASIILAILISFLFLDDLKYDDNNEPIKRTKISRSYISMYFRKGNLNKHLFFKAILFFLRKIIYIGVWKSVETLQMC